MCLLYKLKSTSGSPWLYATMPNVESVWNDTDPPHLLEASKEFMRQIETELCSFTPATVSAAIQQAGNAIPAECKSVRKRKQSV